MRIQCPHCHTNATITNTVPQTVGLRTLYVQCPNPNCSARTVHCLSYSHDATPPVPDPVKVVAELLEKLRHEQRTAILERWRPPTQPLLV